MATINVTEPSEETLGQDLDKEVNTDIQNDVEAEEAVDEKQAAEENNEGSDNTSEAEQKQDDEKADNTKALEESLKDTQQSIEEAAKLLNEKGIDYAELTKEYEAKGVLSEDTYKKLSDAGYPKNVVDTFIRGVEAANDGYANAVFSMVGGKAEYEKLSAYVVSKGQEAVDAFNEVVTSGSLAAVQLLLKGFQAEMTLRNGTSKQTVLGGAGGNSAGYADEAAMTKAMEDPRYGVDDAYTKDVTKRLSKSKFIQFGR